MASLVDEANNQSIAAQIQELRNRAARVIKLDVRGLRSQIQIQYRFPGEERPSTEITINVQRHEPQCEQLMAAVGEVLGQNHAQLQHFGISKLKFLNNSYPQFWRGLAANRVLEQVRFGEVEFPNEPDFPSFLANQELRLFVLSACRFSDGAFRSFCQGIQSSRIKKLHIRDGNRALGIAWSLLWSALEHGATRLESLEVGFSDSAPHGSETGFESLLTNNTNIQSLCLHGCFWDRDRHPFFVALGRGLAVNTTVKFLNLDSSSMSGTSTIYKGMIQTMFAEGLDQNMAVNSLTVKMDVCPNTVNALVDGLEDMMRNRASAATRGDRHPEESLPVLKEVAITFGDSFHEDPLATDALRDLFLDRLSRSVVILVEKVKVQSLPRGQLLSPKVYDFIRSTQITERLELSGYYGRPDDKKLVNLADAMEANNSISEIQVGRERFDTMTNLLPSRNKYRIRCQCRRNEIQVHTLRKNENLNLLPLVLTKLLPSDDTPADENERRKIEARQLVDRTIAYEVLKDIPVLFAV